MDLESILNQPSRRYRQRFDQILSEIKAESKPHSVSDITRTISKLEYSRDFGYLKRKETNVNEVLDQLRSYRAKPSDLWMKDLIRQRTRLEDRFKRIEEVMDEKKKTVDYYENISYLNQYLNKNYYLRRKAKTNSAFEKRLSEFRRNVYKTLEKTEDKIEKKGIFPKINRWRRKIMGLNTTIDQETEKKLQKNSYVINKTLNSIRTKVKRYALATAIGITGLAVAGYVGIKRYNQQDRQKIEEMVSSYRIEERINDKINNVLTEYPIEKELNERIDQYDVEGQIENKLNMLTGRTYRIPELPAKAGPIIAAPVEKPKGIYVTVRSGDSMSKISMKHTGDFHTWKQYLQEDVADNLEILKHPRLIHPGNKVFIAEKYLK